MKDIIAAEKCKKELLDTVIKYNKDGLSIVSLFYIVRDVYNEVAYAYESTLKEALDEEKKESDVEVIE